MRYFTSDLHLGHRNIVEYARRPFPGAGKMGAYLVQRWNATVTSADEVWVLGDLVMGRLAESLPLLGGLRGRVVLVPGNHDRCWEGWPHGRDREQHAAKLASWRDRYLESGVDEIIDAPAVVDVGGSPVRVHHFPFAGGGDHTHEERYEEWRLADDGSWLLCGHVHDSFRQRGRQINVGVDAWGGELVPEHEVAALMEAGPADRTVLSWPDHLGPCVPSGQRRSREVRHAVDTLTAGEPGDRALRRLRVRTGEQWPDVLAALRSDGHDGLAATVEARLAELDRAAPSLRAPLVTGDDLLDLGVPAGPEVGELLRWVKGEQDAGRLNGRDAALDAVRGRRAGSQGG